MSAVRFYMAGEDIKKGAAVYATEGGHVFSGTPSGVENGDGRIRGVLKRDHKLDDAWPVRMKLWADVYATAIRHNANGGEADPASTADAAVRAFDERFC